MIRNTAAQQLAELQKQHPDELFNLLSRVIPFLRSAKWDTRLAAAKAVAGIVENTQKFDPNEDEGDVKYENGHVESEAGDAKHENGILKTEPEINGVAPQVRDDQLQLTTLDIASILKHGKKLVGSADKDHDYALAAMEPAARIAYLKSTLKGRLGLLGEYVEDDISLDKEISLPVHSNGVAPASGLMRIDTSHSDKSRKDSIQTPMSARSPRDSFSGGDTSGLTARQINQLKRKHKANAKDQAKKVRILDLGGPRRDSEIPTPIAETPPIKLEDGPNSKTELFTMDRIGEDDDTKIVADYKGEVLPPKPTIQTEAEEEGLEWPFEKLCDILAIDLFDTSWEIRHGAAMGLREILKSHGAGAARRRGKSRPENDALNAAWLDDMACRYCCVLMLDRFGDYISDNVIAPIRETVGQAVATLLLHLPQNRLDGIYRVLNTMVIQQSLGLSTPIWEVCHGGMLGFKYLGAVRKDFLMPHLDGMVKLSLKGLADLDDDVRAAAAEILIPIVDDLVQLRPQVLRTLIKAVWDCLSELRDDLSASTGKVMDLLAKLCSRQEVIKAMEENALLEAQEDLADSENSFQRLIPRLYPFLRHTITSVRSAVLRALEIFLHLSDAKAKLWVDSKILRLIFQNMFVERYDEVLKLSSRVWDSMSDLLGSDGRFASEFEVYATPLLELALHPVGVARNPIPLEYSLIMKPSGQLLAEPPIVHRKQSSPSSGEPPPKRRRKSEKKEEPMLKTHNVDGPMLQGDVDLVGLDTLIRSRIATAKAYGKALALSQGKDMPMIYEQLAEALISPYAATQVNAAMVLEETIRLAGQDITLPPLIVERLQSIINDERPGAYTELVGYLRIARAQCQSLINTFRDKGKVPQAKLPNIAVVVQGDPGAGPKAFTIANAESIISDDFERLKRGLSSLERIAAGESFNEAKAGVVNAIEQAHRVKLERDMRTRSAAAGALVALQIVPGKPGKLIKGLTDSVKGEENSDLQKRSASSISSLLAYYASGQASSRGPADKIVNNVMKFYCIDPSDTPEFPPNADVRDIILSLQKEEDRREHPDAAHYEKEAKAARVTRRGAKEVIDGLSGEFGTSLFDNAPVLKSKIQKALQGVFGNDEEDVEIKDMDLGQEAADALSILRVLVPTLHPSLHPFVDEMIPFILKSLKCKYSVLRYAAAKCFATICSVWTAKGMTILVEKVLPSIGNPLYLQYRQGVIETIYHLIRIMEDNILPYVVFLLVPILGRMSDSNSDVRLIATTTFATLVKLVPLEAGIPDPPGFSEELLKGRDKERKFVAQMLDPKKTEPFEIPVAIKAKLRPYQQDGVNWLYFLNKFNLHGVLCDDMGLGKTLQTLCIMASDHHIRAEEYAKTQAPEVRRLPSLIVCPSTLSGHWQQEIRTYAPFLTSVAYVGPPADRQKLQSQLTDCDVVITSYEVCRNDLEVFSPLNWNYCILDEGHMIKNPRAKTTIAVKELSSNHRLILSGTPISNAVKDLWSLFDFLMPGFLGTEKVFQDRFSKPIKASHNAKASWKEQEKGALALESLHKQVLPFLLRRMKEDVLEDLPPKIIQNRYCDLSELQKKLFIDFTNTNQKKLEASASSEDKEAKQHIFQALQYMRRLCNTPALVVKEGRNRQANIADTYLRRTNTDLRDIAHAPKLNALKDLLLECGIGDPVTDSDADTTISPHRALIFFQMKEMLDIVQNEVLKKLLPSVQYLRLDGSVEGNKRQNIVNQFNSDPSYDVLLLTTSVGGLGLNLTGADTVIFVEHDWNPQKDVQAMDRAHRIGQKKVVNVYRLITRGTLEDKILNLQRLKMDVASTVVNQQNAGLGTMDTGQILDLFNLDEGGTQSGGAGDGGGDKGREEDAVDATGEVREKGKKGYLDEIGELWDESQYREEFDLDGFLGGLKG